MSDRNHVTLVGNALDPNNFDFREGTSRKKAYLRFGMRVNDSYVDYSGERVELDTIFIDVKVFGQLAENVHASLEKSTPITVTGRLEQYPRAVIFLGEDNREDLKSARKKNKDLDLDEIEFGDDDSVGYVTVTTINADSVSVGLAYLTVEAATRMRSPARSRARSRAASPATTRTRPTSRSPAARVRHLRASARPLTRTRTSPTKAQTSPTRPVRTTATSPRLAVRVPRLRHAAVAESPMTTMFRRRITTSDREVVYPVSAVSVRDRWHRASHMT